MFILNRYIRNVFQGIMPNIGAAKVFTAKKGQYVALTKEYLGQVKINRTRAKKANIRFKDKPSIKSLGTATVQTPFGQVDFYVIKSDTPFLMSLKNMDRLGVYLNNTTNQLIGKNGIIIPINRK